MQSILETKLPRRALLKATLASGLGWMAGAALLRGDPGSSSTAAPARRNGSGAGGGMPGMVGAGGATGFSAFFDQLKREATDEELYRFLYALPKGGDIHHHLGGGFLARRWFAVATDPKRNGGQVFYTRYRISEFRSLAMPSRRPNPHIFFWMTLRKETVETLDPDLRKDFKPMAELTDEEREAWISSVKLDRQGEGRDEFFEYTWNRLNHLLMSIHVATELVLENMQMMSAEGVRYLELMSGYAGWRDEHGQVMQPEAADAFWRERLASPEAVATGVTVKFKAVVLRFADDALDQAREHFAYIDAHRDLWVGIDMAGREDDNRGFPSRFTGVFDELMRKYPRINISIHAGEAEKPDRHIFESLRLGAQRIGHGINLFRDDSTMQLMRNNRHLVEINLVSNHLLEYTPDISQHPFPIYLRQGIPCCLNTDDRGMWDSNMTDEYFVAVKHFNLSWKELTALGRMSLEHAFFSDDDRQRHLAGYEADLTHFTETLPLGNWRAALAAVPAETYGYGRNHLGLSGLARRVPHTGAL